MRRALWIAALLAVLLAGCSTARWTFRGPRHTQNTTRTSAGSEDGGEITAAAAGSYEVIKLPDGSYFIRPLGPQAPGAPKRGGPCGPEGRPIPAEKGK